MSLRDVCASAVADRLLVRRELSAIAAELKQQGGPSADDIAMARELFADVATSSEKVKLDLVAAFGVDLFEAGPPTPTPVPVPGSEPTPGIVFNNLEDPTLPSGRNGVHYKAFGGQLIVDGLSASDVRQGGLGDCYVLSALQAYSLAHPGELDQRLTDNGDGTFTFTFKRGGFERDTNGKFVWVAKDYPITVDCELPANVDGALAFGRSATDNELWVSVIEKAYAEVWRRQGGYAEVDKGGASNSVLRYLDGGMYKDEVVLAAATADAVDAYIREQLAANVPMCAGTLDVENAAHRENRIIAKHAYAVVGSETRNGEVMVELMNPWGKRDRSSAPGEGGRFWLPLTEFMKCFEHLFS